MLPGKLIPLSPVTARVAPFVVFVLLTAAQGWFDPAAAYWFYLGKTLLALWMLLALRPLLPEMRWAVSWEAVVVGVGIFAIWVGISHGWAVENYFRSSTAKPGLAWNPNEQFG